MQNKSRAFTLIELLVVVLIIGILAAIAVPQYKTAVAKARFQQIKVAAESLYKAQQVYYLANGSYPADFESLDISLGEPIRTTINTIEGYGYQTSIEYKWGICNLTSYGNRIQCSSSYANVPNYTIRLNSRLCQASNTIKKQVCASETGDKSPIDRGSYIDYRYP